MNVFADTITLYNHKSDNSYQRTVIHGVMYLRKTERAVTGDGKIVFTTKVSVTIPEDAACERNFVVKNKFRKLEDTSGSWTLNEAENLDIIIHGEVQQELTEDYRLKHLKTDYDCVTVTGVSDNRNRPRLKHIKVVCR